MSEGRYTLRHRKGEVMDTDLTKCKELGHNVVILKAVTYGGLGTEFDGWCNTCWTDQANN